MFFLNEGWGMGEEWGGGGEVLERREGMWGRKGNERGRRWGGGRGWNGGGGKRDLGGGGGVEWVRCGGERKSYCCYGWWWNWWKERSRFGDVLES